MRALSPALLLACLLVRTAAWAQEATPQRSYLNVRSFGARGDGAALDTEAISKAIAAANAAGGGTVVFPLGVYLSGTLELLSNVTLELQAGVLLQASPNVRDYGSLSIYGFGRTYAIDSSGDGSRMGLIVARKSAEHRNHRTRQD